MNKELERWDTVWAIIDRRDILDDLSDYTYYNLPQYQIEEHKIWDRLATMKGYYVLDRDRLVVSTYYLFPSFQEALEELEGRMRAEEEEETETLNERNRLRKENLEDIKNYYAGFKVLP